MLIMDSCSNNSDHPALEDSEIKPFLIPERGSALKSSFSKAGKYFITGAT
jgi:hypothetical protein